MLVTLAESTDMTLTILAPLIAVPLTAIIFYLRSLRELSHSTHSELSRRITSVERSACGLREALGLFGREFTSKDEWLRECMLARNGLDKLRASVIRLDTTVKDHLALIQPPVHSIETQSIAGGETFDRRPQSSRSEQDLL